MNIRILSVFWERLENHSWFSALRNGMIFAIPAVMAGSCAVLLNNIPINTYLHFINTFAGGFFSSVFVAISSVTLSSMPLILLLTISYCYADQKKVASKELVSVMVLCSYMVFSLDQSKGLSIDMFQNTWLVIAIVFALIFSNLFVFICDLFEKKTKKYIRSDNFLLNRMLSYILPAVIVLTVAVLLRTCVIRIFGETNLNSLISEYWLGVFQKLGRTLPGALLFSFLNQVFWFFGIHGSNVLDAAAVYVFETGISVNVALMNSGFASTEIVSKTFLDVFIFLGGCGTTLSLLVSVLVFSKRTYIKNLANFAIIPALCNINEILLFGIPIVYNPIFLIPFILTPCILTCVSYAAMYLGFVPAAFESVGWTVPIFLSGYAATGSIRGSLLQLFNLLLGVAIYTPFILYYQKIFIDTKKNRVTTMITYVKECEGRGTVPDFNDIPIASIVINELLYDLQSEAVEVFYQPQYDYDGNIIGVEALLRWNMGDVGYVYPPLTVALAEYAKASATLDKYILKRICSDIEKYKENGGKPLEFSFNISFPSLTSHSIMEILDSVLKKHDLDKNVLCLEITEQAVFQSSAFIIERLEKIRSMGIRLAMDDFGMGHTSLVHLTDNNFDMVKLDGSLIQGLTKNPRCADIILSIVGLSRSMGFDVIAEYVETEDLKERLHELGCDKYQGYLFSKALPFDDFLHLSCKPC